MGALRNRHARAHTSFIRDIEHNDCVDFFDGPEVPGALEELRAAAEKRSLPFDEATLAVLLQRHSLSALSRFCDEYQATLGETTVLLHLANKTDNSLTYRVPHTSLDKAVYYIGEAAYLLLDAEDCQQVWNLAANERRALMAQFGNDLHKLVHTSSPSRSSEKRHSRKRATVKLEE